MPKEYLGLAWRYRRKRGRAGHGGLGEKWGLEAGILVLPLLAPVIRYVCFVTGDIL